MKGLQKEKKDVPAAKAPMRASATDSADDRRLGSSLQAPAEEAAAELRERLLRWYEDHRRALPWRENRDPYGVMVSEFMLQQTRVEVVEPRFREFLRRFATVDELAGATREDVHDAWSGLGYYRRADLLHAAASAIAESGAFPDRATDLERLPGFGPYTSAAVASIAFDEAIPVLDGNVERVTTRLLAEPGPPRRAKVRRHLQERLRDWMDADAPGDFNQAMMELGATVCRPKSPRCEQCPLESLCSARAEGRPTDYPAKPPARVRENWHWIQFVVFDEEKTGFLVVRRESNSEQLAGRWELPGARRQEGSTRSPADRTSSFPVRAAESFELRVGESLGTFRHSITHRDFAVDLMEAWPSTRPSVAQREGPARSPATQLAATDPALSAPADLDRRWVGLADFDERGRWRGRGPLPASSMLAKAVRAIREGQARKTERQLEL